MPDGSFKVWHVALNCDHPAHRKTDLTSNDWEETIPETTLRAYRAEARDKGWIFHSDGRLTCPVCAQPPHRSKGE